MKTTKLVTLGIMALIILTAGLLLAGCTESKDPTTYSVQDDAGDFIELTGHAQTVVCLAPSLTEIMFQLGMGDKVVGVDSATNYPAEATSIEKVSDYTGVDTEKIVALAPDLVLMDKTLDISGDTYKALTNVDLVVYRAFPQTVQDITKNIQDIGVLVGAKDKAEELVDDFNTRVSTVGTDASGDTGDKPVVLYVIYYDGTSDPWVGTTSTFAGSLISTAGGECKVEDTTGFSIQISLETIISMDPDIIICSRSTDWPTPSKSSLESDSTLSEVAAIKNNMVIEINGDLIDRTGPRMVEGLEEIRTVIEDYHG